MNNLIDADWWKTATLADVKAEIAAGADVMKDNWQGLTSVHMAALYGSPEIIQALINAGADTTAGNCSMTPLHYALKDPGKVKALLAAGAEVDARPEDSTPLRLTMDTPLFHAVTGGTEETIQLLIDAGANVMTRNAAGITPLHAVNDKHTESIKSLLSAGANIMARDNNADTPLHTQAAGSHCENVRVLLSLGADANAKNKYGDTPLHSAKATYRFDPEVMALLEKAQEK